MPERKPLWANCTRPGKACRATMPKRPDGIAGPQSRAMWAGSTHLAVLYVMGKGVPRDIAEAVKWYRRAADQGNALAQYNLGMRYSEGDGVPQDLIEAYAWLSLASAQGLEDAVKARDELKRRMTREQIAESQRRANAFADGKP